MSQEEQPKKETIKRYNTWKTGITPPPNDQRPSHQLENDESPRYFTSIETERNLYNLETDRKMLPNNLK
jgi:hypothetical protein